MMFWILFIGYLFCAVTAQTEVGVEMLLVGVTADPPEMTPGTSHTLQFKIIFPDSAVTTGTKIELLVSLTELVFAFGDSFSCTPGTALTFANTNYCADLTKKLAQDYNDTTDKIIYYTHVIFEPGDVTSGGGDVAANTLTMECDVVFITHGTNAVNDIAYLSAGMAYNNEQFIWVAQMSVKLLDFVTGPGTDPTFDLVFVDTELTQVGTHTVELTVGLPNPKVALQVEILSLNDTECELVVEKLELKTANSAYAYQLQPIANFPTFYSVDALDTCCPASLLLDMGTLVNKESQKTSPDTAAYDMVFEATVAIGNQSVDFGQELVLGAAIYLDSSVIWVSSVSQTTAKGTMGSTTFTPVTDNSSPIDIPVGMSSGVHVTLTVPAGSALYHVEVITAASGANTNGLSVLAISVFETGNNNPCVPSSDDIILGPIVSTAEGLVETMLISFPIFNHALQDPPLADSNDVQINVELYMMPSVTSGETFTATVKASDHSDVVGTAIYNFAAAAAVPYDSDVTYTFDLQDECGTEPYQSGSVLKKVITVFTQADATPGPFTLELPIPEDLVNASLSFVSAEVIQIGANVVCLQYGNLNITLSDWQGSASGTNDRAVIYIPVLCNKQNIADTKEDEFKIEVKFKLKEIAQFTDADTNDVVSFSLGIRYSPNQIWVADSPLKTRMPDDFLVSKIVTGITLPDGVYFPDDARIQWSADNINFNDFEYNWNPYTVVPGSVTTMLLDRPLYTRYMRIINTDGGCAFTYTPIKEANLMEFHGHADKTAPLLLNIMTAFDQDLTTCYSLPTRTSTDTATYFFLNIPSTYLGVTGTAPFTVNVTGEGLTCANGMAISASQVLKLSYRKDTTNTALKFAENRKKAASLGAVTLDGAPSGAVTCSYSVACTDGTTCVDLNMLLLHRTTPSGAYSLCDIRANE